MLAILTQTRDTAKQIQSFQSATVLSLQALHKEVASVEDNMLDRLREAVKPPCSEVKLNGPADREPVLPAARPPQAAHPPRISEVEDATTAHVPMGTKSSAGARPAANVEGNAFFHHVSADFQDSANVGGSESASPPDMDFQPGEQAERPSHPIKVPIFGRRVYLVTVVEWVSLVLVCLNSIFTGIQANLAMSYHVYGEAKPEWVQVIDVTFTIVFALEFFGRWWLWGRIFFTGLDKVWNAIDLVCVVSSILDVVVVFLEAGLFPDMSFIRLVRMFRILRVMRAVRGLRAVRDLRLLIAAIMASMASFFWGFCLLCFTIFLFDIAVMQSLVVCADSFGRELTPEIYELYGTVFSTWISLFKAISGGMDWGDLVDPLNSVSSVYVWCYMGYISIVVFGVMNILTAIFCEQASQIAKVDPGLVIEDEMARTSDDREQLKKFFYYADVDKNGMVDINELERGLKSPERRAMLNLLQVDVAEARALFDLLDVERRGTISLNAYIDALLRLRGAAKGCDAAMLLVEHKRLLLRLTCFMCYTHDTFLLLFKELKLSKTCQALDKYISNGFLAKRDAEARNLLRTQLCTHLGAQAEETLMNANLGSSHDGASAFASRSGTFTQFGVA